MKTAFLATALLLGSGGFLGAQELTVSLNYLSPDRPSPFHGQLLVRVSNEGFMSVPLLDKIKTSQLLVDGHPFSRTAVPFKGPEGLPVKGAWEGCLGLDDYLPEDLTPGMHHLQLRIGQRVSKNIRVKVEKITPPAKFSDGRLEEAQALAGVIPQGLLRSCVENWLKNPDGGAQGSQEIRYYLHPNVKVLVSYEPSQPEPRVRGRIKIYDEARILD